MGIRDSFTFEAALSKRFDQLNPNIGSHVGYQGYFYSSLENENEITPLKFWRKILDGSLLRTFYGSSNLVSRESKKPFSISIS